MNAIVTTPSPLVPRDMASAMGLATMMSSGKLVPVHLRGSPGDCLMVIEQAMRWGMSPFAVAQCTSVISGRLMFEGKLVAAALNTSGILASRLSYEFSGSGDSRKITVSGVLRGETAAREITVELKDAKTTNEMWRRQPDQQLVYFTTRAWARRHAPEVMLGVYAPEEFDAETGREDAFDGTTLNGTPEPEAVAASAPASTTPPPVKRRVGDLINELEARFGSAMSREEVDGVLASDECQKLLDIVRNGAKGRLDAIVAAALDRTSGMDNAEENVAA